MAGGIQRALLALDSIVLPLGLTGLKVLRADYLWPETSVWWIASTFVAGSYEVESKDSDSEHD